MEYLTGWRMFKASRVLRSSELNLGHIARSVGYDSEAAFGHAFKRVLGVTPATIAPRAGQRNAGLCIRRSGYDRSNRKYRYRT